MSAVSILLLIIGAPIAGVAMFWFFAKIGWMRDDLPPGEKDVLQRFGPPVLLVSLAIGLFVLGGWIALVAALAVVILFSLFGAIAVALVETLRRSSDAAPPLDPFLRRVARYFVKGLKEFPFHINPFSAAFH